VTPLILNLDTKWRRNSLFMGAEGGIGVATGPGLLPVHSMRVLDILSGRSVESVPAHCCPIADLFLSVMTSA